ncbi:MAG: metallophosphoesterase [Deferribacteres bacterium]|nr:metallophosphoesterase [Deferribacteres bacterium]
MKVGVISDTHDHLDNVEKALSLFKREGASLIIHCGDIISPFCLELFNKSSIPYLGVLGNNDGEIEVLLNKAGDRLKKGPRIEDISGAKVLINHYHHFVDEIASSGKFDFIFYGHTHTAEIKRVGDTLVVNPGEACGWITRRPTVALVDLSLKEAELIELG